ncbi:MAG TPA: hypothetical protein VG709_05440 [Actinomycetota bacterium]|nr:hypothetical protein [Actinomycetota bacterium]
MAGVVAAAIVLGAGTWFMLSREGGPLHRPDVPRFSFQVVEVGAAGVTGGAHRAALGPAVDAIRQTLDALYVGGFIDPGRWANGEFPALADAFAGDATARAREDVADLTLGPAAEEVSSVNPIGGRLDVRFLLGDEGNPFAAWATTVFRARGVAEGGDGLAIEHRGRYLLRPVEDRWLIVGYDVTGRLRPGPPARATP